MKVMLSSIGSRGDVQPLLALAIELRSLGHDPVLCVPPNFRAWIESHGVSFAPIGPDVQEGSRRLAQGRGAGRSTRPKKTSKALLRNLGRRTARDYFRATLDAARGSDLILTAGVLQVAGRTVAEALKIPHVYAAYCPAVLRSADHPPPKMRSRIRSQSLPRLANRLLWKLDERSWNRLFRATINDERTALGLPPIITVPRYVSTDRPWLAADPLLGPRARTRDLDITQTGAWLLSDMAALPDDLERFLAEGAPPIYFGFGSMQASPERSRLLVEAARAVGRRAILSRGWAHLTPDDGGKDCFPVGDVNHERLFPRVAAVVHHGGAGTTATAARAGTPQVLIPHLYDQYYWAHRVRRLGIGESGPRAAQLTLEGLVSALRRSLEPQIAERARAVAPRIEPHGARIAAERLVREFG